MESDCYSEVARFSRRWTRDSCRAHNTHTHRIIRMEKWPSHLFDSECGCQCQPRVDRKRKIWPTEEWCVRMTCDFHLVNPFDSPGIEFNNDARIRKKKRYINIIFQSFCCVEWGNFLILLLIWLSLMTRTYTILIYPTEPNIVVQHTIIISN